MSVRVSPTKPSHKPLRRRSNSFNCNRHSVTFSPASSGSSNEPGYGLSLCPLSLKTSSENGDMLAFTDIFRRDVKKTPTLIVEDPHLEESDCHLKTPDKNGFYDLISPGQFHKRSKEPQSPGIIVPEPISSSDVSTGSSLGSSNDLTMLHHMSVVRPVMSWKTRVSKLVRRFWSVKSVTIFTIVVFLLVSITLTWLIGFVVGIAQTEQNLANSMPLREEVYLNKIQGLIKDLSKTPVMLADDLKFFQEYFPGYMNLSDYEHAKPTLFSIIHKLTKRMERSPYGNAVLYFGFLTGDILGITREFDSNNSSSNLKFVFTEMVNGSRCYSWKIIDWVDDFATIDGSFDTPIEYLRCIYQDYDFRETGVYQVIANLAQLEIGDPSSSAIQPSYILPPVYTPITEEFVIICVKPLIINNTLVGVTFSLQTFYQIETALSRYTDQTILFDMYGNFIASSNKKHVQGVSQLYQVDEHPHSFVRNFGELVVDRYSEYSSLQDGETFSYFHAGDYVSVRIFEWRTGSYSMYIASFDMLLQTHRHQIIGLVASIGSTVVLVSVVIIVGVILLSYVTNPITNVAQFLRKMVKFSERDFVSFNPLRLFEIDMIERNLKRLSVALAKVEKLLPREVVSMLMNNSLRMNEKNGGNLWKRPISIIFVDIVKFCRLCEKTESSERLVKILCTFFEICEKIINEHNGSIDKIIGGCVMATFNTPVIEQNHERKAVRAGVKIVHKIEEGYSRDFPVKVTVGINSGKAICGLFGSRNRISFSSLGDVINVAARVQAINREYRTKILITEFTFTRVKSLFFCMFIDCVKLRNRGNKTHLYTVLGEKCDVFVNETIQRRGLQKIMRDQEEMEKLARENRRNELRKSLEERKRKNSKDFLARVLLEKYFKELGNEINTDDEAEDRVVVSLKVPDVIPCGYKFPNSPSSPVVAVAVAEDGEEDNEVRNVGGRDENTAVRVVRKKSIGVWETEETDHSSGGN